jgi:hypothetical protein
MRRTVAEITSAEPRLQQRLSPMDRELDQWTRAPYEARPPAASVMKLPQSGRECRVSRRESHPLAEPSTGSTARGVERLFPVAIVRRARLIVETELMARLQCCLSCIRRPAKARGDRRPGLEGVPGASVLARDQPALASERSRCLKRYIARDLFVDPAQSVNLTD